MDIHPLTPDLHDAYRAFLSGRKDDGWVYYSLEYKAFLESLLHCESRYQVAVSHGQVSGVVPIMCQDGPLGTALNSLPFFGSHGGILADNAESEALLFKALCGQVEESAVSVVVAHPLGEVDYTGVGSTMHDERISQITDLLSGQPEDALWMSFDGAVRRNVRKAEKSAITVSEENDMFSFLQDTHQENMDAMGGTPKAPRFFQVVPECFRAGQDFKLYVARHGGEPVAALLLLFAGTTVEYFVPVIKAEYRTMQPLALLVYRAMQEARDKGFVRWNWGGTWTTQEGVYRFKRKWAAQETGYEYHIVLNNKEILTSTPERLLQEYPNFYTVPFSALQA